MWPHLILSSVTTNKVRQTDVSDSSSSVCLILYRVLCSQDWQVSVQQQQCFPWQTLPSDFLQLEGRPGSGQGIRQGQYRLHAAKNPGASFCPLHLTWKHNMSFM
ncbi:hypothetical protein ACQJBY_006064 [Aegilops geniculata]